MRALRGPQTLASSPRIGQRDSDFHSLILGWPGDGMMVARGSCKWDTYLFLCFPFPPFLLPSSLISSSLSRDPPFLAPSPLSTSSPPFFVLFSFGPAHYPSFLVLHMLQVFHVRTFWSFFHFSVSIVTVSMVKAPTSVFRLVHRFPCQCFRQSVPVDQLFL